MGKVILISGASSGFGALAARALADAGHTVYAGMRDISARNAGPAAATKKYATERGVDLRPIEIEAGSQISADAAVSTVLSEQRGLDVVVHNAGSMVSGPTEAFTPERIAAVFDTNVLGSQRLNRAVLPHLRSRGEGLLIWVGSSSTRGGTPPYIAPYFAAKAAMDALAVSYAAELARFGIETTIVVPGAFATGTRLFSNGGEADDRVIAAAYEDRYPDLLAQVGGVLAELQPPDANAADVATAMVELVDAPYGKRPFRIHVDPLDDGSSTVSGVADYVRKEFLTRIGLRDLLAPSAADRVSIAKS